MDLGRHTASWRGSALRLTVTEFRILHALAREPGRVKTRDQLLCEGYPQDQYVSDRTIDSHIKRVRRKLETLDPSFDGIEGIYGLGYRWRGEPEP
jgi:two-component system response regulator ChvI